MTLRRPGQAALVADHELEAPAPEVEGQRRPGVDDHAGPDRGEDQPRLLLAADHVDADARLAFDVVDDRGRVVRLAQGAGRAGDDLVGVDRLGQGPEPADHLDRPGRRLFADPAADGDDVGEAKDLLFPHQRLEGAVGMGVGDEEVEGVAPEVESGDPHASGL